MSRNTSHVRFMFAMVAALSLGTTACGVGQSPEDESASDTVSGFALPQCGSESGCPGGDDEVDDGGGSTGGGSSGSGGATQCTQVSFTWTNETASTIWVTSSVWDSDKRDTTTAVMLSGVSVAAGATVSWSNVRCVPTGAIINWENYYTPNPTTGPLYGGFRSDGQTAVTCRGRVALGGGWFSLCS